MLHIKKTTIKTLAPYIGAMLILIGYIKLRIYYWHFSVQIENYISFTEVLIVFLPDVILFGIIMLPVFLLKYIGTTAKKDEQTEDQKSRILNEPKFSKRLGEHYKFSKLLFWISLYSIVISILVYFFNFEARWWIIFPLIMFPVILIYIVLLFEFKRKYMLENGKSFDPSINNLVLVFFLFALFSITSVSEKIQHVYLKSAKKISFNYNEEIIETNSRIKYLGETEKYVFLYNTKEKESKVYIKSKIDDFTIKELDE